MSPRLVRRLAAAVVLTAAAGSGLVLATSTAPASAATCGTASGVSVVVDFKELGGGIQGTCLPDGAGKRASALFPAAGFPLAYVQNQPGFVCRVSQKPAQDPCVDTPPNDRYWGLWWSDGKTGTWSYANYGASSLKVPAGASVAFAWKQGGGSATAPAVAPAAHAAPSTAPTPTAKPTKRPTRAPSKSPTRAPSSAPAPGGGRGTGASAPATTSGPASTATASASASPTGSAPASETPGASASASAPLPTSSGPAAAASTGAEVAEPEAVPASAQPAEDEGVPTWLVLSMLALVLAAIAAVLVQRRRAGRSPEQ